MAKTTRAANKLYCEQCDTLVEYEIITKNELYDIRGEKTEIESKVAKCNICGNELFDPYLENENLKQAYRKYAQKHSLVLPEDIKRIRKNYGLSQAEFAQALGIGKATIERYESGALPTESLSTLIKSAESPESFLKYLRMHKDKIKADDYTYIEERIKKSAKSRGVFSKP